MKKRIDWGWQPRDKLLSAVKAKLAEYAGTAVTVRQLYYRLVADGVFPNVEKSYKNLGKALSEWRREGELDFSAFEDRTREMHRLDKGERVDDPIGEAFAWLEGGVDAALHYKLARWYGQSHRVVVAVEKQALQGPFLEVCKELDVDLVVCKGHPSLSYLNEIANALEASDKEADGREIVMLYFGDFDPTGLNIPDTIERDLRGLFGVDFTLEKIALTGEQARSMKLLPAPVKMSDSRADGFIAEHGSRVYELDAIEPRRLAKLIEESVEAYYDDGLGTDREELVEKGRRKIKRLFDKGGLTALMKKMESERKTKRERDLAGDGDSDDDDEEEA